jgi:hypothetical protein
MHVILHISIIDLAYDNHESVLPGNQRTLEMLEKDHGFQKTGVFDVIDIMDDKELVASWVAHEYWETAVFKSIEL